MAPIYKRASEKNEAQVLVLVYGNWTCRTPNMNPLPPVRVQMRDLRVWRCKTWICFLACKPLIENITCWVFLAEGRPREGATVDTDHILLTHPNVYHMYTIHIPLSQPQHSHPSNYQITLIPPQLQPHNPQIDTWVVESAERPCRKPTHTLPLPTTHSLRYNVEGSVEPGASTIHNPEATLPSVGQCGVANNIILPMWALWVWKQYGALEAISYCQCGAIWGRTQCGVALQVISYC